MRLINSKYYKQLTNYIDNLIDECGRNTAYGYVLSTSDIDDNDMSLLISMYLEASDRDVMECFYDNSDPTQDSIACALLNMLRNNDIDSREDFVEAIYKNSMNKYKDCIQEIIDERCAVKEDNELRHDDVAYQYQDRDMPDLFHNKYF